MWIALIKLPVPCTLIYHRDAATTETGRPIVKGKLTQPRSCLNIPNVNDWTGGLLAFHLPLSHPIISQPKNHNVQNRRSYERRTRLHGDETTCCNFLFIRIGIQPMRNTWNSISTANWSQTFHMIMWMRSAGLICDIVHEN